MSDIKKLNQEYEAAEAKVGRAVAAKVAAKKALDDAQRARSLAAGALSAALREDAEAVVDADREAQAAERAAFIEERRG